ncbi:lysozyme C, milk isozyme-like isoform X2 [Podarcis raffonei]|nr:lysozyme C, milk isozyme-like isoform X2 [Podarcis raffonei]
MVANETRKFEDCELFYKLRDLGLDGFRGIDVKQYVCMAGFPANYNTEYYETEEGVPHYGLFHLSGQEWCFNERRPSQNKCNISCDYLLDDDIADDVRCLKKVITEKGLDTLSSKLQQRSPQHSASLMFLFFGISVLVQKLSIVREEKGSPHTF